MSWQQKKSIKNWSHLYLVRAYNFFFNNINFNLKRQENDRYVAMTDIPCLAPLLPILPGYRLQPTMFHVIGNIKQSKKIFSCYLILWLVDCFHRLMLNFNFNLIKSKVLALSRGYSNFLQNRYKALQKIGKTNQNCNWILTRESSTCATLVSTLLRAAIAWKVEEEIKSANQLCKWSPDGALESKDGKSLKIGNS